MFLKELTASISPDPPPEVWFGGWYKKSQVGHLWLYHKSRMFRTGYWDGNQKQGLFDTKPKLEKTLTWSGRGNRTSTFQWSAVMMRTQRRCITHCINMSVTYEEEANVLSVLATCRLRENPWRKMPIWNEEMGIPEKSICDLVPSVRKNKRKNKLVSRCEALFELGLLCDMGK